MQPSIRALFPKGEAAFGMFWGYSYCISLIRFLPSFLSENIGTNLLSSNFTTCTWNVFSFAIDLQEFIQRCVPTFKTSTTFQSVAAGLTFLVAVVVYNPFEKIVKQILYIYISSRISGRNMKQIHEATMKPLNESQYMCVYIYIYVYDDYFFSNKTPPPTFAAENLIWSNEINWNHISPT